VLGGVLAARTNDVGGPFGNGPDGGLSVAVGSFSLPRRSRVRLYDEPEEIR
jgi:hypothetical protein